MYRYVCEVCQVSSNTARNTAIPSLSLPGAAVLSGALLALSFLSVQLSGLFIITSAVSGALFCVLLLFHRSPVTLIAPALCAVLIACTAPDTVTAVVAFIFLPVGFSAAFSIRMWKSRMAAIAIISVAAAFVSAVSAAVLLVVRQIPLPVFLQTLRADCIRQLTELTVITADAGKMPIFTEESASILVSGITLLFPAIAGCALFLIAYISTGLVRRMLIHMEADVPFLQNGWRMIPTKGMAVVYIAAQISAFLFAAVPDAQALYYAFYNLSLIFLLPLSVLGLSTLFFQFRRAESLGAVSRLALVFLALMIAAAGLYWFLTFAAFYGIYIVFQRESTDP